VRRKEAEADDKTLAQSFEVVVVETGVNDVEEDGRNLGRATEGVFYRRVFREKLGGKVGHRDVFVVRREGIALEAKGTDPQLSAHVDLAVRVEHSAARRLARHRLVQHWRKILAFLQRRIESGNGHDGACGLYPRRRPDVPGQSQPVCKRTTTDELGSGHFETNPPLSSTSSYPSFMVSRRSSRCFTKVHDVLAHYPPYVLKSIFEIFPFPMCWVSADCQPNAPV
jgi:hypothetical protein